MVTVAAQTKVVFQVEPWARYVRDAPLLWRQHYQEVALDQEVIPLDMDEERYAALDAAGQLHIVTGRDEGRLIAYWTGIVQTHLHYKGTLMAFTDLYYISPPWRRGMTALRLFGTAHRTLKARGVVKIASGCKLHSGLDMTRLFTFMGYSHAENLFTKLL